MSSTIKIEVAYALPNKQVNIPLEVEEGTSMWEAVERSGIAAKFPDLNLAGAKMGIFEKPEASPKSRQLKAGERVCIYRPLIIDPKESRKQRAAKTKK